MAGGGEHITELTQPFDKWGQFSDFFKVEYRIFRSMDKKAKKYILYNYHIIIVDWVNSEILDLPEKLYNGS